MITIKNFGHIDYGRFGNQVFQYALGKILSLYHGCDFYVNPSDYFLKFFNKKNLTYKNLKKNINQYSYIEKDPFVFDENIFTIKNIDILGFFQNLSYYKNYLSELYKEFVPNQVILNNTYDYIKNKTNHKLNIDKSVCIHVRRTDYLQLQGAYGFLDSLYYNQILLDHNLTDHTIFVISDDITRTNQEFYEVFKQYDVHYVNELDAHHDFYIMYLSRVNILANSTYSWWASLLSDFNKNNKQVYAPYPWINHAECAKTQVPPMKINLYPDSWYRINYTIKKWDKLFI